MVPHFIPVISRSGKRRAKAGVMRRITLLALVTLPGLMACATHPVTGRQQLMLVPDSQVIEMSRAAYQQMGQERAVLPPSHAYSQRVTRLTTPIIRQAIRHYPQAARLDWQIRVFRDDTPNAFALAGGLMGVNSGLIDEIKPTDDELAQVIAHEIAHVLSGHSREKLSIAMSQQLGIGLAGSALGLDPSAVDLAQQVGQVAISLPYSRTMETEADVMGLELAARAGHDPRAVRSLWKKMNEAGGARPPEWLSTHPGAENRMRALSARIPEVMPLYREATGSQ
ncbi:MAG: M48 family metallopeptidase [Halothiobacillaceae bacterium]